MCALRILTTRATAEGPEGESFRSLTATLVTDELLRDLRAALAARFRAAQNSTLTRTAIRSAVLLVLQDVMILVLFGTALSSIVNCNLTTTGQASAVGTNVSAGYGFLCGAYMPISNFGEGLQRVLSFLPGTYGTALFRNHALRGVYAEMTRTGFPAEVVEHIKDSIDCSLYFFGSKVSIGAMTGVMAGSVAVLIGIYILMNLLKKTD